MYRDNIYKLCYEKHKYIRFDYTENDHILTYIKDRQFGTIYRFIFQSKFHMLLPYESFIQNGGICAWFYNSIQKEIYEEYLVNIKKINIEKKNNDSSVFETEEAIDIKEL